MQTLTVLANLPDGLNPLSLLDGNFSGLLQPTPTLITLAGTDLVPVGSFGDILVNAPGPVTLQLPPASLRTAGAVSVINTGGNASTYNITLLPFGAETIMGLPSLVISVDWGAWTVYPISTGGWYTK